jgi:transposase
MASQKQAVMDLVEQHRGEGRRIGEVLASVGVARSSYYRWRKGLGEPKERRTSSYQITEEECRLIEEVKEAHPEYRHRRIQGALQSRGVYLSASAIYGYLRQKGWVEPYERRAATWKDPRCEVSAEKSDVGMRLDSAHGGWASVVSFDCDRFLFPTDRSL